MLSPEYGYLQNMVISRIWLSPEYGYLQNMVISRIWLSPEYGYLQNMVISRIWLSPEYGYLQNMVISRISPEYVLPKFELFVGSSLIFTVRVYGWLLMDDHDLCKKHTRSFSNIALSHSVKELGQYVQDLKN